MGPLSAKKKSFEKSCETSYSHDVSRGRAEIPGYYYDDEKKKYFKVEGSATGKSTTMYTRERIKKKEQAKYVQKQICREKLALVQRQPKVQVTPEATRVNFSVPEVSHALFRSLKIASPKTRHKPRPPMVAANPVSQVMTHFIRHRAINYSISRAFAPHSSVWYARSWKLSQTIFLPPDITIVSIKGLSRSAALIAGLSNGCVQVFNSHHADRTHYLKDSECFTLAKQLYWNSESKASRPFLRIAEDFQTGQVSYGICNTARCFGSGSFRSTYQVTTTEGAFNGTVSVGNEAVTFTPVESFGDTHDMTSAFGSSTVVADGDLECGRVGFLLKRSYLTRAIPFNMKTKVSSIKLHPSGLAAAIVSTQGHVGLIHFYSGKTLVQPLQLEYESNIPKVTSNFKIRYWHWLRTDERFALAVSVDGLVGMLELLPGKGQSVIGRWIRIYEGSLLGNRQGTLICGEQSFCVDESEELLFQVNVGPRILVWPLWKSPIDRSGSPIVETLHSFPISDDADMQHSCLSSFYIDFIPNHFTCDSASVDASSCYINSLFTSVQLPRFDKRWNKSDRRPLSPFVSQSKPLQPPTLVIAHSNIVKLFSIN